MPALITALLSAAICFTAADAAEIATLSLADSHSYVASASNTATLTGSAIDIVGLGAPAQTGIPEDGFDVHASPELYKALVAVADKSCKSKNYNECFNQLSDLLVSPKTDLQVRQVVVAAALVADILQFTASLAAAFFGFWVAKESLSNEDRGSWHIPAQHFRQASSIHASSYTAVALATGKNAPFATITIAPSAAIPFSSPLITPASVTTQAVDSNTNKKGDIVFSITESQARRWQEIIARSNVDTCDLTDTHIRRMQPRQIKNSKLSNVLCAAERLLANMVPGGSSMGLSYALPARFSWRDPDTNEAMHILEDYARRHAGSLGVDDGLADRWGIAAFTITRAVIIGGNPLIGDGTTPSPLFVPASDIDIEHPPKPACESVSTDIGLAGCRMQGAIKACTTRFTTTTTCLDSKPSMTSSKKVILTTHIVPWTVSRGTPYIKTADAPAAKPTLPPNQRQIDQGDLICNTRTDPGNAEYFVDREMMLKGTDFFCDHLVKKRLFFQPDKVGDDQKRTELNYNDHMGDPVYLTLDWINDPGCPLTDFAAPGAKDMCLSRLKHPIDDCDTSNPNGAHFWKQGGSFFRDCMKWTIRRDSWVFSGYGSGLAWTDPRWTSGTKSCYNEDDCSMQSQQNQCPPGVSRYCKWNKDLSDQGWCACNY